MADAQYKIAIVDDDDFLVDMYSTKFALNDASVKSFKGGKPFLEALKSGLVVNIILLDIVMPEMTGLQILKEMRDQKLAEGTPVVMLTNQNDEKDISEAKMLGVEGYIVKSAATPSEVVEEVMKIIKK